MQSLQSTPILERIVADKRAEVDALKTANSDVQLRAEAETNPPALGFVAALRSSIDSGRAAVIAEVKKASPSNGVIRANFSPADIASSYQRHGASCVSVLTDEKYFQGHNRYLEAVRVAIELPLLRKDFIIDASQIFQSRCLGADCILLIVAILDDAQLIDYSECAIELGMDVLVEVHDEQELHRALALGLPMIGINNRNLNTFVTSLDTTIALRQAIGDEVLIVTESGIATRDDIELLNSHGIHSFLVGESFMRAADPGKKMAELFFNP